MKQYGDLTDTQLRVMSDRTFFFFFWQGIHFFVLYLNINPMLIFAFFCQDTFIFSQTLANSTGGKEGEKEGGKESPLRLLLLLVVFLSVLSISSSFKFKLRSSLHNILFFFSQLQLLTFLYPIFLIPQSVPHKYLHTHTHTRFIVVSTLNS